MHDIGIGHVFDLRSKPEVDKGWKGVTGEGKDGDDVRAGWKESMRSVGVERTWCPVFDESDYSPERLAERYMVRSSFPRCHVKLCGSYSSKRVGGQYTCALSKRLRFALDPPRFSLE